MFVYTLTRKRAFRMALVILAVFVGIAIGVAAIMTAISTDAAENKLPIYSVDRGDNKIALTFDCAWSNSNTDELLAILKANNAKATFFVTGEFCDNYPDDVRKMADAGHEVANHSDKHPHIKEMNLNDLISDTKECAKKIKLLTGKEPSLYRSPYGEYNANSVTTIEGMKYKFIQWSVDSIDWQEPDAATITKRVLDNTVSGSIILFHNDLKNTEEALPVILKKLTQSGFVFVTVSDLIYTDNYTIDNTGKQIKANLDLPRIGNPMLDEVMAIAKANLTYEEIASIKSGLTPEVAAKITPLLSSEQLDAISSVSASEYAFAWDSLMTLVEAENTIETTETTETVATGKDGAITEQTDYDTDKDVAGATTDAADAYVKGAAEDVQTTAETVAEIAAETTVETAAETVAETTVETTTEITTTEFKK